jgi:hypothetical protein
MPLRDESLLDFDGACWLGVDTDAGPIALPGEWTAKSSLVGVPSSILAAVQPRLPGHVCVTIDDSDSLRPSDKSGIIARGDGSLPRIRDGIASIRVDVTSTSTWNGFRSTVSAA